MTEWHDFPNVKFTEMLSFFSVLEAYGLIYSCPLGQNSSFACLREHTNQSQRVDQALLYLLDLLTAFQ